MKKEKVLEITKEVLWFICIMLIIVTIYYGMFNHRWYTLAAVFLIGSIIWIMDLTRMVSFRIDRILKQINQRFWMWFMLIVKFFNFTFIRYSLVILTLLVLGYYIYSLIRIIN